MNPSAGANAVLLVLAAVLPAPAGENASADSIRIRHRALLVESWNHRVRENGGVHSWSPRHASLRVFQEWTALLAAARDSAPPVRRRLGLELERYVVGGRIRPLGFHGTSLPVPGLEEGDFDMAALNAVSLVKLFEDDRLLLTDRTYAYLIREVIGTFGENPKATFDVAFLRFPETENHFFMIESNRFLMNELLGHNPRGLPQIDSLRPFLRGEARAGHGGQRAFLLRRMQDVLRGGFFEFNARVYQRFTAQALNNLYSFARDSAVAAAAGCALDYLSAVFAVQSLASIRYGPYRRSSETYLDRRLVYRDALCSFFAVQTGAYPWDPDPARGFWRRNVAHASAALYSTLLRYRVPEPLVQWMRAPGEYEAWIRSAGGGTGDDAVSERYTGGPGWLLSAGGRYQSLDSPNFPTLLHWARRSPWVYDVIARPATLMLFPPPSGRMEREEDLVRTRTGWDGEQLALHRRFLYAAAPSTSASGEGWPFTMPEGLCPDTATHATPDFLFRFCHLSRSGLYLVFSKLRTGRGEWLWKRRRTVRGGLEVVPADAVQNLAALQRETLRRHSIPRPGARKPPLYVAWDDSRMLLNPRYRSGNRGLLAAGGPGSAREEGTAGPALLAARLLDTASTGLLLAGDGRLRFRHPATGAGLDCDCRQWWRPQRRVIASPGTLPTF